MTSLLVPALAAMLAALTVATIWVGVRAATFAGTLVAVFRRHLAALIDPNN